MWPRKRFEIGAADFLRGAVACLQPSDPAAARRRLEHRWNPEPGEPAASLACLSVRSAFDLYLRARAFPPGSEILMTGANIPDMARLVDAHGLVPVAVDFDLALLAPTTDDLEALRTPRSRTLLFAHLFGAIVPLDGVASWCRAHGIELVEDCAQAFHGDAYRGHPAAALSMFSFGPIKSATALAGALVTVRRTDLGRRMADIEQGWPMVRDASQLRRLAKYAALSLLTHPAPYTALAFAARRAGRDLDDWVGGAARSFPGDELLRQIRRRPGGALLTLLRHRLHTTTEAIQHRTQWGRTLAEALGDRVEIPGAHLERHSFWVFPILTVDPGRLVRALRRAGFDATRRATLAPVSSSPSPPTRTPESRFHRLPRLEAAFARLVYLPFDARMPKTTVLRLAKTVRRLSLGAGP